MNPPCSCHSRMRGLYRPLPGANRILSSIWEANIYVLHQQLGLAEDALTNRAAVRGGRRSLTRTQEQLSPLSWACPPSIPHDSRHSTLGKFRRLQVLYRNKGALQSASSRPSTLIDDAKLDSGKSAKHNHLHEQDYTVCALPY